MARIRAGVLQRLTFINAPLARITAAVASPVDPGRNVYLRSRLVNLNFSFVRNNACPYSGAFDDSVAASHCGGAVAAHDMEPV